MTWLKQEQFDEIHRDLQQDWQCQHSAVELRQKVASNGQPLYRKQCLRCGQIVKTLKRREIDPQLLKTIPLYDDELQRQWFHRKYEDYNDRRNSAEEEEKAKWFRWYNQYLRTPQWKVKRELVMARALGICEGCRIRPPAQVHHLTYDHAGDELLWELVAVCKPCHQRAHPDKKIGDGDD